MREFHSNGKLLISGEYVVLDGATALSVPTSYGQSLKAEQTNDNRLHWKSYDHEGRLWLEQTFSFKDGSITALNEGPGVDQKPLQERLRQVLTEANQLNPQFLQSSSGIAVTTHLDFPKDWGLGSSSTLINNIAEWFQIDPYKLLERTFGGSGYDIASAQVNHPITFTRKEKDVTVLAASFNPSFADEIFFVHLNRKQSSRESIQRYRNQPKEKLLEDLEKISRLTHQIIAADTLTAFELLLEIHENIISGLIKRPKVKSELFPDYPRTIKSLGGWGGDFVLATGGEQEKLYFQRKGYQTILPYNRMVL